MSEVLSYFIGALINGSADVYIWSKLLNKKFDFKDYKNYLYMLILVICMILLYFFVETKIKTVLLTFFFILFVKLIFKTDMKKSIVTPIYGNIIVIVAELFFGLIVLGIFKVDADFAVNNLFVTIYSNLIISVMAAIICNFKIVLKLYNSILDRTDKLKEGTVLLIMMFVILTINILFSLIYYKVSMITLLIINIAIIIIYTIITFKMLEEKNNTMRLTSKYNTTLDSLKEYEDILNKYRILNHENKNQLEVIRNMISSKDKKVINHIDKLIGNKKKDNENLMKEISVIPPGGLRAVVYSKLLVIKESGIKYLLNFDKQLSTVDLVELGDDTLLDICNILNVFLDNAIDAAKESKNKSIGIQMYVEENELFIEISNTYIYSIDIDKISNVGYTTKEDGHGYGLTLVKQIIDKNKSLENIKKCEGNMFVQILKIKM